MSQEEPAATSASLAPPLDMDQPACRRWAVLFASVAIALLLVMAVPALRSALEPIDEWFWRLAVENEYSFLVTAAEALAFIGGSVVMTALTVAVATALAWRRRWTAFLLWLLVIVVAEVVNASVKMIYERPRPPTGLTEEHTWSFASGHSLSAAVMALMLVLVWVPAGPRRRGLLVLGAAYALIMAASRVYLRAHWFTDVIAGLTIGAATGLTVLLLAAWWSSRSTETEPIDEIALGAVD